MSDEHKERVITDLLGIKEVGQAVNRTVDGLGNEVHAFLERICYPAAKEYGLLLKDKVKSWRSENTMLIVDRARKKVTKNIGEAETHCPPRIVHEILDKGSWIDDSEVQEFWAGLLASSCTDDGTDDGNLIFINLLSQLTNSEAKLVNYLCTAHPPLHFSPIPWYWTQIYFDHIIEPKYSDLLASTGINATSDEERFTRLETELRHLNSLDLIKCEPTYNANLVVTRFGWIFYVRCMGSRLNPKEYFKLMS